MKGKYSVIFCEDVGLTIELLEGDIYLEDLMKMLQQQVYHPNYNASNNVITDVRKARLHITQGEMEKLVGHIADHGFLMVKKKVALLTKEPYHVVASTLFSLNMRDLNHPQLVNIYSTVDAVLRWLILPWNSQDYKNIIRNPARSSHISFTSE